MNSKDRPIIVNVEKLTAWERKEDEAETTYGEAVSLEKRLMTVTDNPTVVSDECYGDGEVAASYSANMGGTLDIGLTDLLAKDRVLFYGETSEEGTNIISKNDIGKYVIVAYMSKQHGGKVKLTKYMRVLFAPTQEQEQQVTKSGRTWNTKTLSGTYMAEPETGVYKYVREQVDPVTDKELITKWFSDAEYHGEPTD